MREYHVTETRDDINIFLCDDNTLTLQDENEDIEIEIKLDAELIKKMIKALTDMI